MRDQALGWTSMRGEGWLYRTPVGGSKRVGDAAIRSCCWRRKEYVGDALSYRTIDLDSITPGDTYARVKRERMHARVESEPCSLSRM